MIDLCFYCTCTGDIRQFETVIYNPIEQKIWQAIQEKWLHFTKVTKQP
jgi:hypothetical protein